MLPEKSCFVAEDNLAFRQTYFRFLRSFGYGVVVAGTLQEAREKIPQLGQDVQIAIVDGNLSPNAYDGSDGEKIVAMIREHAPWVKIIGITGGQPIEGTDANIKKEEAFDLLAGTIQNLLAGS